MKPVYVTGNVNKAKLFSEMLGINLENVAIEVEEIQSLDAKQVAIYKAKSAYEKLKKPVLVEDTFLVFPAFGLLPGTFVKWFLDQIGAEGLARLLDGHDRSAIGGAVIVFFDGINLKVFEKRIKGTIAQKPAGEMGWGFDPIFIPEGCNKTQGQMNLEEYKKSYARVKPFKEIAEFLKNN